MRLFNWRRQAALNAMPLVKPDQVRTPWHEFWRRFRRQHMAMTAALFVILLIVVAIFARWIAPYDAENYFDYDNLNNGPSLQHWFGVDSLGRDIFSRVLVGAQISLAAGVFAVFIGAAIGTLLGLLALKTNDPAEKTRLYKAAQDIIWQESPWIPLVVEKLVSAHSKNLTGFWIMPDTGFSFEDADLQ